MVRRRTTTKSGPVTESTCEDDTGTGPATTEQEHPPVPDSRTPAAAETSQPNRQKPPAPVDTEATAQAARVGLAAMPRTSGHRPTQTAPAAVRGYDGPAEFAIMWQMAESLAEATILPRHFYKQPGNVFAVMAQARAADIPVFVALQHFNVIDGRVEESAELVRAMLYRAGWRFDFPKVSDTEASMRLWAPGADEPITERFTIIEAANMGLTKKDNWVKTPASMLVARVTTRAASRHAPHVTMGLANLSHAELGDTAPEQLSHLREGEQDPRTVAAGALWQRARELKDAAGIKAIGQAARHDSLLDVLLDGGFTLNELLIGRLDDLKALTAVASSEVAKGEDVAPLPCGCDTGVVLDTGEHGQECRLRVGA